VAIELVATAKFPVILDRNNFLESAVFFAGPRVLATCTAILDSKLERPP
jgi:hypothetical protein